MAHDAVRPHHVETKLAYFGPSTVDDADPTGRTGIRKRGGSGLGVKREAGRRRASLPLPSSERLKVLDQCHLKGRTSLFSTAERFVSPGRLARSAGATGFRPVRRRYRGRVGSPSRSLPFPKLVAATVASCVALRRREPSSVRTSSRKSSRRASASETSRRRAPGFREMPPHGPRSRLPTFRSAVPPRTSPSVPRNRRAAVPTEQGRAWNR